LHSPDTASSPATARRSSFFVRAASGLVALLVGGALFGIPQLSAAQSMSEQKTADTTEASAVQGASLDWGVKESFRNYITGPIAHGEITTLGTTTENDDGTFHWSDGSGEAANDGSSADVSFSDDSGVHFLGHKGIDKDNPDASALDIRLTNPHIVVTSQDKAELRADVKSREFIDTTTVSDDFFDEKDVAVADVELPDPKTDDDGTLTWQDAPTTLTESGAEAFGGFYETGDELDPLTLSVGGDNDEQPSTAVQTITTVQASSAKVKPNEEVTLTAKVLPASAPGSIQFSSGKSAVGSAVKVQNGAAKLTTKELKTGTNNISATFTPDNAKKYSKSRSATQQVVVAAAPSKNKTVSVTNAKLDWGVKDSFRSYLTGAIAHGKIETLAPAKADSSIQSRGKQFHWSAKNAGKSKTDGTTANAKFTGGVHFTGHRDVGSSNVPALDLRFTNPRVVLKSATEGTLFFDAKSRKFEGMSNVSNKFFDKKNVAIANLKLGSPEASKQGGLRWSGVKVQLTKSGVEAFGEFYDAGTELDPLDLTLNFSEDAVVAKKTTTKLTASAKKINTGQNLKLTAKVSPNVAGSVTFEANGKKIGKKVKTKGGKATLSTKSLPKGVHKLFATFTPDNSKYAHSLSNSIEVTVAKPGSSSSSTGARSAATTSTGGSLSWGVSKKFVAYTTCNGNENYGMSHCATNGSIGTSGVGSGWLFPQSASKWNKKSHTGTVNFSGTVRFNGYGLTMFEVKNPSITVHNSKSATLHTGNSTRYGQSSYPLDLSNATKTVNGSGAVTWSNVAVRGSLMGISEGQSIGLEGLSFTVGSVNNATFKASKQSKPKKQHRAAATAPSLSGIQVLTDSKNIREGGRIKIKADGFDAKDSDVIVALYQGHDGSGKMTQLDDSAKADDNGTVHWSGTLPKKGTGSFVITLQGSKDAGALINIHKAELKSAAQSGAKVGTGAKSQSELSTAGIGDALSHGGMAPWEWWSAAIGLWVIAGCTTLLAVRQRRNM
jgi:hypothetical protein